jgi:hypothetical protein
VRQALLIGLLCALGAGRANAQVCSFSYSLNYATYTSVASIAPGGIGTPGTLYSNVLVDGAANMAVVRGGCPDAVIVQMENAIANGTHQGVVTNQLGNSGGRTYGPTGCVSCYVSYYVQNNKSLLAGQQVLWTADGGVFCSVGGLVFNVQLSNYAEIAKVMQQVTGPPLHEPGYYHYIYLTPHCDAAHTPPDFAGPSSADASDSTTQYFISSAPCIRLGTGHPWHCALAQSTSQGSAQQPPYACTRNP